MHLTRIYGEDHPFVQRVLRALRRSGGNLSGREAAALVGLDPCHFSRSFSKLAGFTYRRVRLRAKLEPALPLLTDTARTIQSIAWEVGYRERCKFDKSFLRVFEVTPAAYRRQKNTQVGA